MTRQITTAEQLETLTASCFENGEYFIVAEGWRPWIITEDQHGDAWAWSWLGEDDEREGEGPGGTVVVPEALKLPLTVLYEPGEQPCPLPDRDEIARTLAEAYGDDLPAKYASLFEDIDLKAADAVLALLKGEPT